MPSAVPAVDVSIRWPVHKCGYRHAPVMGENPCPRPGVWLVSGQRVDGGRACTATPILHAPSRRGDRR